MPVKEAVKLAIIALLKEMEISDQIQINSELTVKSAKSGRSLKKRSKLIRNWNLAKLVTPWRSWQLGGFAFYKLRFTWDFSEDILRSGSLSWEKDETNRLKPVRYGMKFVKMHGAGNDYVYVDGFSQPTPENQSDLARRISDRHFGVGADGLILIERSEIADAKMRIWNADGSFAEMCGNGIRCVAKYLIDSRIVKGPEITVETETGVLNLIAEVQKGRVRAVRVEMGLPVFSGEDIPTTLPGNPPINESITFQPTRDTGDVEETVKVKVTSVSMGNPHCVLFAEELTDRQVLGWGPALEQHPAFPQRTNVEFARVLSSREIELRVWERGSGETLACGTGACAAVVAGVLTGRTGRAVTCKLPGGELQVEWSEEGLVFLSGPAEEVFCGDWPLPDGLNDGAV